MSRPQNREVYARLPWIWGNVKALCVAMLADEHGQREYTQRSAVAMIDHESLTLDSIQHRTDASIVYEILIRLDWTHTWVLFMLPGNDFLRVITPELRQLAAAWDQRLLARHGQPT